MKRKIFILSAAIAVVTVWSLFFAVQPAYAVVERVQYVEKSWDADSKRVVSTTKTANCVPITSDMDVDIGGVTPGWYVVNGDITIEDRLVVWGQVNIILTDGSKLTVEDGISVLSDRELNIYAQAGDTGELIALADTDDNAAIGSDETSGDCGTINIHGGKVTADTKNNGEDAAGIGGGEEGNGGTVTIYGGTVKATGGSVNDDGGAGIGGGDRDGDRGGNGGTTIIYGGDVTAQGGANAAGIGGGDDGGNGGTVKIYGGTVKATGGSVNSRGGAGIGGGGIGSGGRIEIHGGEVTAKGGANAAGIGGGDEGGSGDIFIYGGTVNATGGSEYYDGGAGIGSGNEAGSNNIYIYGGNVTAQGGCDGAGIGGGDAGDGGTIIVDGADAIVNATGGKYGAGIGGGQGKGCDKITIKSGSVTAQGGSDGAGIGGGEKGNGGTINITGGRITATGGSQAAGIGGGDEASGGTISISGGTVIATGGEGERSGAGIGSGRSPEGGGTDPMSITLSGDCDVTATGGNEAAGIGGGNFCWFGEVTIEGGTVVAQGGEGGPGIGNGYSYTCTFAKGDKGISVTITGGNVRATGGSNGAGIGGGHGSISGVIRIDGGTVEATGGDEGAAGIGTGSRCCNIKSGEANSVHVASVDITINGGSVIARAGALNTNSNVDYPGVAIGTSGSQQTGAVYKHNYFNGTIALNGGTITAYAAPVGGDNLNYPNHGMVIGTSYDRNFANDAVGNVEFNGATVHMYPVSGSDGVKSQAVLASSVSVNGQRVIYDGITATKDNRVSTLISTGKNYVLVEPCTHAEATLVNNGGTHTGTCSHCGFSGEEPHRYSAPTEWNWNNDNTAAQAVFQCACGHKVSVGAEVTLKEGDDTKCVATATLDGKTYTAEADRLVYDITVVNSEHGSIEVNSTARVGREVGLDVVPDENYHLKSVAGDDVTLNHVEGNHYTFTMPKGNVTLRAEFVKKVAVKSVSLNKEETTLSANGSETLVATVLPEDTDSTVVDRTVTWKSGDESVATVDETGKVTAVAPGAATITVTATNGTADTADDKTATCSVTVNEQGHTHEWGEPSYTWAGDNSTVTAKRMCKICNGVETEKVETSSAVAKLATCTEKGKTTYTATFKNKEFKTQTETVEDIDALGHRWGEASYTWNEDNTSVTATHNCKRDAEHVETETVSATSEVTKQPTCEVKGETTYTSAAFTKEGFKAQTKTEENIDAPGHSWGEASYTWAKDNSRVTATHRCTVCRARESEKVYTTSEVTKEPTCSEEGEMSYTSAAFDTPGFEVQTKTGVNTSKDAEKHDWGEWTKLDDKQHQRVCGHDAAHVEKANHTWDTGKVTKEATTTSEGEKTYTCTLCNATKTEIIPKLEPTPAPVPSAATMPATTVNVNNSTASAAAIQQAIQAAGGNVDTLVLGSGVKKISKGALAGTNIRTLVVTSKKLKKKSIKGSLKGSIVTTVKVEVGNTKMNKKYVKKYKKYFTKKNCGKKVRVRR